MTGTQGYATPLQLEPRSSRQVTLGLVVSHSVAGLSLFLLPVAWVWIGLGLSLLGLSLGFQLRRQAWLVADRSLRRLRWEEEGEWLLTQASGQTLPATLRGDTYIGAWLVVLNFRLGRGRSRTLLVTPDRLDDEDLRRLRVRLTLMQRTRREPTKRG